MKEVYASRNPAEAQLVRGLLEDAGISAVVQNEQLFAGFAERGDIVPSVLVLERDAQEAQALVADWLQRRSAEATWTCPGCGESVEEQFTECWHCGASRPA